MDNLSINELFEIKGGAISGYTTECDSLACNNNACQSVACVVGACENHACLSGGCSSSVCSMSAEKPTPPTPTPPTEALIKLNVLNSVLREENMSNSILIK